MIPIRLLTFLFALYLCPSVYAQRYCDVNFDNNVDISDIVSVINVMSGSSQFQSTADVNADTHVDISDVVAIINLIAKGTPSINVTAINVCEDTVNADVLFLCDDGSYIVCDVENQQGYGMIYLNTSVGGELDEGLSVYIDENGYPVYASTANGYYIFKNVTENKFDFAYVNNNNEISYYRDIYFGIQNNLSVKARGIIDNFIDPYIDAWKTLRSDGHWQWDAHNKKALFPYACKVLSFVITALGITTPAGFVSFLNTFANEFYKSSYYQSDWLDNFFFGTGIACFSLSGINNLEQYLKNGEIQFSINKYGLVLVAELLNKYGDNALEKLGELDEMISPKFDSDEWKISLSKSLLECEPDDGWYLVDVSSKASWEIDESGIDKNWCEIRKLDEQIAVHVKEYINQYERECRLRVYAKNTKDIESVYLTIKQKNKSLCPDNNHPHAIDLGIGVKWACCNVGASAPWESGGQYAWGETYENEYYDYQTNPVWWAAIAKYDEIYQIWKDVDSEEWPPDVYGIIGCYEQSQYANSIAKYYVESVLIISSDLAGTEFDAAHVKWGGKWLMPNINQIEMLLNNCSVKETTISGVYGLIVTGKNGNCIFLPGYPLSDFGGYWSSTLYPDETGYAYSLNFFYDYPHPYTDGWDRSCGQSVRPVTE